MREKTGIKFLVFSFLLYLCSQTRMCMEKILLSLMAMLFMCGVSSCSENHEYVDLGLPSGTLWATCNVGASKPTEYGDLFAWGETSTKEDYSFSTYKWCENKKVDELGIPHDFTKYCTNSEYGTVDNKKVLDAEDDAVNWGGSWRMPTDKELRELVDGCDWTWTDDYDGKGIAGQIGKSKYNGSIIFLPAAGFGWRGFGHQHEGTHGLYSSSSLDSGYPDYAYGLDINLGDVSHNYRYLGYSVRAVCPSKK